MAVIGTFGSFTAARLGIYASQSSLNVTGNNIANINTKGYTRQRMDLVSLHSAGNSRYRNGYNLDIGYGVLADGVSQMRDPFLDIRYRDMNSNVGTYEARLKGLNQVADILDEVGDGDGDFGIIEDQFNDLVKMLNNRNYRPGTDEYDTTVRASAQSLTNFFRDYADSLAVVKDNLTQDLKSDVDKVNTILEQIRDLNVQIRDAGIYGDKALELRDARNVLIDDLSGYMKIDVRYDMEKLDEFSSVERINITLANSGNPPIKLVQGIYATQLEMPDMTAMRNPEYNFNDHNDPNNDPDKKYISAINVDNTVTPPVTTYTYTGDPAQAIQIPNALKRNDENFNDDNRLWMSLRELRNEKGEILDEPALASGKSEPIDLGDTQLYGSLQAKRELITGEGEFASEDDVKFDENANIKRGVPYYQHALDSLVQQFAKAFNDANRLNFDQVKDAYKIVEDPNSTATPKEKVFADKNGGVFTAADGKPISETYFDDVVNQIGVIKADNTLTAKQKEEKIAQLEEEAYGKMEELRLNGELTPEWSFYKGGVLFSNKGDSNDPTGITAANITISKDWSTGAVRTLHTKNPYVRDPNTGDLITNTTADDNIFHMVSLMGQKLDYKAGTTVEDALGGDKAFFSGTFQEMLANMNLTLGMDGDTTGKEYDSYTQKALNLENSRQSVSGVDLNDEALSMMQFQKSYSAACQLLTTLDSMLDKLINGTL